MARTALKRSLATVVGPETYAVWVQTLRTLVPDGRTHRLAVVIAGMLQYAAAMVGDGVDEESDASSVAAALVRSYDAGDPSEVEHLLHDVVNRLFKDAGVDYTRTNSRGQDYTITDNIYEECVVWYNMPWE